MTLPLMSDPDVLRLLDVLSRNRRPPHCLLTTNLSALVVCRMVSLSLEHGNSDGSVLQLCLVWDVSLGRRFNDYKDGFRFAKLGYDLVEKRGLTRYPGENLHFVWHADHAVDEARSWTA